MMACVYVCVCRARYYVHTSPDTIHPSTPKTQHHALRGLPLPYALVGDEALARVLHRVQTQGLAYDRWLKQQQAEQAGVQGIGAGAEGEGALLAAVLRGESDGGCAWFRVDLFG